MGSVTATRTSSALEQRTTAIGRRLQRESRESGEHPAETLSRLCGGFGPAGRARLTFARGSHVESSEALTRASYRVPTPWLGSVASGGPVTARRTTGRSQFDADTRVVLLNPADLEHDALHELVHVVEASRPNLRAASWAFLARRGGGRPPVSLAHPDFEHDESEVGVPGLGFVYAGKVYDDGWTEALACGVPGVLLGDPRVDDDHAAFTLGALASL